MDSTADEDKILISVKNIHFRYEYTPVLIDVSFTIHSGDFLAIIGPNGSGKTTLLKIILRLLKPSLGKVRIMGKPAEEFEDWPAIGYVPQKATHVDPLFPVSVKEVVAMGLFSSKRISLPVNRKEESAAVQNALCQVGLSSFRNRRIGKLSAGQQQRVFIARAIVNRPRILFLDEPTTGVDAETQERFYDMLDQLNKKEGITIALITHDIGIINKHVTKVACLNQKLVYHGTHEDFCRSEAFKEMLTAGHHLISHRH
ncbi:MAG: ATP-binding cassette domain-containing protein [Candidatus Aminicenantes bacterium]|nr:ATP-binding cassette domain-containing protein [Candidatus Aminicenantes bacterium]